MKTNKEIKRQEKMAARAKFEAFRHHVDYVAGKRGINVNDAVGNYSGEMEFIRNASLVEGFLELESFVNVVENELGIKSSKGCPQLDGAIVPYILGITEASPTENSPLAAVDPGRLPLQLTICFTTDDRLAILAWLKNHAEDYTLSTRLGQPIIKFTGITVELQRIVSLSK